MSLRVKEEHRSWTNGGARLEGILTLPEHDRAAPVVIALHSASAPGLDAPLYAHLTNNLLPLGVAVLRYDRRGHGRSRPGEGVASYQDLAADAVGAMRGLQDDPRIDPHNIYFWGLSQGGWLAMLAARQMPHTAGVIAVSAPMCPPPVQMEFAVANVMRILGFSPASIASALALRAALDRYARTGQGMPVVAEQLQRAAREPWFKHAYVADTLPDQGSSRWDEDMRLDPLDTLMASNIPTLLIYGQIDPWVPVELSVAAVRSAGCRGVDLSVIADADHSMMVGRSATDQVDPHTFPFDAPDSVAYFRTLSSWISARLRNAASST